MSGNLRWDRRRAREAERKELGLSWEDYILHKAREWNDRYGMPPAALDWNPPMARKASATRRAEIEQRHAEGLWPGASTVTKLFGSWNAMLEQAGMEALHGEGQRRRAKGGRPEIDKRRNTVAELWREGYTAAEIAERLGVTRAVVTNDVTTLRRNGEDLPARATGPRAKAEA